MFFKQSEVPHIHVVEENVRGEDIIGTDVHGCHSALIKKIERLPEHSRLFLAGDLCDRDSPDDEKEPTSYKVFETVIRVNKEQEAKGLPPKIYVTRGNHENMFLRYYNARKKYEELKESKVSHEKINGEYDAKLAKYTKDLQAYIETAAAERSTLYPAIQAAFAEVDKLHKELLNFTPLNHMSGDEFAKYFSAYEQYYESLKQKTEMNGGMWAFQYSLGQLAPIADFISKLPYITHVKGNDPFNVVHAELPFSWETLQQKVAEKKFMLTKAEKQHAIWARPEKESGPHSFKNIAASSNTPWTYCGHNVGNGLRADSKHLCLDNGAFVYFSLLFFNHHTKRCEEVKGDQKKTIYVGDSSRTPAVLLAEINAYFQAGEKNVVTRTQPPPRRGTDKVYID